MADYIDAEDVARWVVEQWDEQVSLRPPENVHRRTLDDVWRQIYRFITNGRDLPRPKHREPASNGKCPLCSQGIKHLQQ